MAAFQFRAAAALDLRVRVEETATRELGEARGGLERAERSVAEAVAAIDDTVVRSAAGVADPSLAIWYRNWMTSQRQALTRRQATVTERTAAVDAALARLHAAHRDVRVLERLRERLHAAWDLAERRKEQKDMDWLGSVRYALKAGSHKEST